MFVTLARALDIAIEIFVLLIIIRAVLSFFPQMDRGHPLVRTLDQVVEPVLRPFQRLMPNMGGLDFSPILAILTLQIVGGILTRFIAGLGRGIF
ncbi:MAG: YggT family protein [Candidatus Sericytochromatia bacterium]